MIILLIKINWINYILKQKINANNITFLWPKNNFNIDNSNDFDNVIIFNTTNIINILLK